LIKIEQPRGSTFSFARVKQLSKIQNKRTIPAASRDSFEKAQAKHHEERKINVQQRYGRCFFYPTLGKMLGGRISRQFKAANRECPSTSYVSVHEKSKTFCQKQERPHAPKKYLVVQRHVDYDSLLYSYSKDNSPVRSSNTIAALINTTRGLVIP